METNGVNKSAHSTLRNTRVHIHEKKRIGKTVGLVVDQLVGLESKTMET